MTEPEWIAKAVALALHDEQLAEHGGQAGLCDENLLDSALERPKNRFAYGNPDMFDLAAAYAFGIVRNIRSSTGTSVRRSSRQKAFFSSMATR